MAGKRAGLGGARSGLFWEICRLLDETKTQNFILENVPGLLSSNQGKDMAAVLEALVERGYRIGYRVLDAQYFGVPQRRRRVFIVGSLGNSGIAPEKVLAIAEGRSRYLEACRKKGENLARKIATGINKSSRKDLSNLAQTLRSGGDGGVPSSRGENLVVQDPKWWNGSDVADTLTVSSNEQRMPDKNKMQMIVFDPHRSDGVRIQNKTMNTLTAIMGTGGNNTPMVAYPMHGAMIGRKDTAGPNGSGFLGENAASYTLTASEQSRHGVGVISNESSIVRRLTPVECERLQGFPDEWTSGQADQHRYKQMGNAVAVPVVEWIIKRLVGEINA
jgi:DNA (cytosine-5)-methyltransferase 1